MAACNAARMSSRSAVNFICAPAQLVFISWLNEKTRR
jgi:hypothetical protein